MRDLPNRPFIVLGIPYRVEVVDRPDPYDVDCVRYIERARAVVRVRADVSDTYMKRLTFGVISRDAAQLLDPGRGFDYQMESAFSAAYYGMFKKNPKVLAFCVGWTDEIPRSVEVGGVSWPIKLVDFCPGGDKDTFGLALYLEQTIYLLSDLNLPLMRQVLIHELGHAVAEVSAPGIMEDEAYLRAFQISMYYALRDNEKWIRYLFA